MTKQSTQNFWSLAVLFVVFCWHIGRFVNDFYVPESDFFDFRDKAIALRHGEWPNDFKRPPLYASLIAAVSLAINHPERELYAAEAINVIAAIAAFLMFYLIARRFFDRTALVLLWVWAFHPSTVRMAVKPKSEIVVTALILTAFYLFLRGRKTTYLVGFLASLVRYEGVLIIAAVAAADFFTAPKKLKTVGYALLSGGFIVLWTLLQPKGSGGGSYFDYFENYHLNWQFLRTFWEGFIGFLPSPLFKFGVLAGAWWSAAGLIALFRRDRRTAYALSLFLIGFMAMHIVWPMPNADYQVIIVWSALLMISAGVASIAQTAVLRHAYQKIVTFLSNRYATIFTLFLLLCLAILALQPRSFPQYQVQWRILCLTLTPVLFVSVLLRVHYRRPAAVLLLQAAFLGVVAFWMSSTTSAQQFDIRYSKAEFRLTGEWFAEHYRAGMKAAVEQPYIVAYYAGLPQSAFVRLTELPAASPADLHRWLQENGVTHIIWLSANRIFETDNAWYRWKMANRGWKTIDFLSGGENSAGFTLVETIVIGPRTAYIYAV